MNGERNGPTASKGLEYFCSNADGVKEFHMIATPVREGRAGSTGRGGGDDGRRRRRRTIAVASAWAGIVTVAGLAVAVLVVLTSGHPSTNLPAPATTAAGRHQPAVSVRPQPAADLQPSPDAPPAQGSSIFPANPAGEPASSAQARARTPTPVGPSPVHPVRTQRPVPWSPAPTTSPTLTSPPQSPASTVTSPPQSTSPTLTSPPQSSASTGTSPPPTGSGG